MGQRMAHAAGEALAVGARVGEALAAVADGFNRRAGFGSTLEKLSLQLARLG